MSNFTFNCSSCGQHISGDTSYVGLQIVCPACGKTLIVPATPPAPTPGAPSVPPIAAVRAPVPLPPTQQTSGLAIASLICSIGSFVIIPLGFIPGIICGHMARKKIASTPGLVGDGLAKAGLIVGYIALTLQVLVMIALIAFFALFAARIKHSQSPPKLPRSVIKGQARTAVQAEKETTDTEPDGSGWTMSLADVEFPSGTVTGRIHGEPFKADKVALQGGWLKFSQGKDFFPDLGMEVVTFKGGAADLSGQTFEDPKEEFGTKPHIWMKWKEDGAKAPKSRCFTDRYALRLEFGELSGETLPGKIYLCLPDEEKSFVAGTFEVPVKSGR